MRMNDRNGKVDYDDEAFGSWLACERDTKEVELKFWQRTAIDDIDKTRCAKVDLIAQDID